jgi:2-dehydro-3-deoxyphosphogluconate aldolase / (4S)-4-hydroxy-2-oxoglutarate aldolase
LNKYTALTKISDCGVVAVVRADSKDEALKTGGVGGNLVAPAKTGNFEQITEMAKAYIEKVQAARGA